MSILRKPVEPHIKKAKPTLSACPVLVEAFLPELAWEESPSDADDENPSAPRVKSKAKVPPRAPNGKELNLKEITDRGKMKQALTKEWTTWTVYSAVDTIPES